jgi:hypothetical protein
VASRHVIISRPTHFKAGLKGAPCRLVSARRRSQHWRQHQSDLLCVTNLGGERWPRLRQSVRVCVATLATQQLQYLDRTCPIEQHGKYSTRRRVNVSDQPHPHQDSRRVLKVLNVGDTVHVSTHEEGVVEFSPTRTHTLNRCVLRLFAPRPVVAEKPNHGGGTFHWWPRSRQHTRRANVAAAVGTLHSWPFLRVPAQAFA